MPSTHLQDHIDLIAKHEQDFLAQRTASEQAGDSIAAFAGSFGFIGFHLILFLTWISYKLAPHSRHFDPASFSLLGTIVALEGMKALQSKRFATLAFRVGERYK